MPTRLCQWCLSSLSASISTVSQLCSLRLAQDSFSSFLVTGFVPLFAAWGFFLGQFLFQHPPRIGVYSPDIQGLSQSLICHRDEVFQKSELNSPRLSGICNSVVDPEAGMSYRSSLSFGPCTFLSVLLESKVCLRFCLLSFQSHSKHSLKEQLSLYPDKLVQLCPERPLHCLCQGLMTGDC